MIGEKKSREEFLTTSLKELTSIENALKRIYARIPYICNLSKNTGSVDDCRRVLGLPIDKKEINDMSREISLLKLNVESSVSKISSLAGMVKKQDNPNKEPDNEMIRAARIASSRINDFSRYVAAQASMPESELDTSNTFLLKANSEYGIKDVFGLLRDKISSIQREILLLNSSKKFVMSIPCGVNDTIEKDQTLNFIKQVILSTEPALENSLSTPKAQPKGELEFHFDSKEAAEKARAAIIVSFKQSNNASISISSLDEANVKNKGVVSDLSM